MGLFNRSSNQSDSDLTTPENVAKGQKVDDQIKAGQVRDVPAALAATSGRKEG
jgi:hypothetical protein